MVAEVRSFSLRVRNQIRPSGFVRRRAFRSVSCLRSSARSTSAENIDPDNRAYRRPLEQSARALLREIGDCEVVLLGSIASPKYVDALLQIFGTRLLFPADFVGRGDMSRGGLLLRHAAADIELSYVPV